MSPTPETERWPVLVTRRIPRAGLDLVAQRCDMDLWEGPPEAIPREDAQLGALAAVLERFGERAGASPKGVSVRLRGGEADLAEVVRALDAEDIAVEHLQLHAPSLDDVFLAKTGRSLEGAGGADEEVAADAEAVAA